VDLVVVLDWDKDHHMVQEVEIHRQIQITHKYKVMLVAATLDLILTRFILLLVAAVLVVLVCLVDLLLLHNQDMVVSVFKFL
jgi:hypothetical protein|tara:strand:+ start:235 stop:480 length:246 start_codon:yes stop_codon:yes gene_type:complete